MTSDLEKGVPVALTKAELAASLVESIGLNGRESKELVDLFFEEICSRLEQGDAVKLSGFGNFELREKRARPGRNPKTGEVVPITARRVVAFTAGEKLRLQVASPDRVTR
jgi:integration host factor subunit alpha